MDLWKMNVWQIFLAGGPVMWPILLCSIFALAIIIDKIWHLHSIEINTQEFLNSIKEKIKSQKIEAALRDCQNSKSPIGKILMAGILKHGRSKEELKEAIEDAALFEVPKLEKNLSALATLAHISPLLGLFGTVTGMVRCFQTIQIKSSTLNTVSPGDLASGIWEALLTTVAGLAVAIPAFIAYNYLVTRVNNFILEMEKASTELVNFLTE